MMQALARLVWAPLLVVSLVLVPWVAQAGLIGDTVTASLRDNDAPFTIFNTSAIVTDPGAPEFSGTFQSIAWTLDILNNGFSLHANCLSGLGCNSGALTLTISSLDFTPPGTLVGLSNITSSEPLTSAAGSPAVSPSSVTINFQAFSLNTGANTSTSTSYAADFQVRPRVVSTPFPATLLLLVVALPAAGILAAWRRLS
jgi:hypothetical protein